VIALAITLSALMGVALGLLGGGGSILTVPILVWVVGLPAKSAIATSLLVVAATALVGLVPHGLAGAVRWRTGLLFGGFAMAGAYGGGRLAAFIPGAVLLLLFAGMMLATAVAMLRRGSEPTPAHRPWPVTMVEGLAVGAVTGLVGAGGGFLVVPALVLLGGLKMHEAIGTSLLVIAMKSFAGFAGYAGHVDIEWSLALPLVAAAAGGALIGAGLGRRITAVTLRRGFAWFVLAMAAVVLGAQLPADLRTAVFVDRWPFWAGGAAIGGTALAMVLFAHRALGVSTGYADACAAPFDPVARRSWRLPFLAGIVGGGALAALLAGGLEPRLAAGVFDSLTGSRAAGALLFAGGGVLLGFGARMAGGCTSGHSIVGVALRARSSLLATGMFMAAGLAVTWLLFGGAR
jgi:uncharacterized membrane protein YfcA